MRYTKAPASLVLLAACVFAPAVVQAQDSFSAYLSGFRSVAPENASAWPSLPAAPVAGTESLAKENVAGESVLEKSTRLALAEYPLAAGSNSGLSSGFETGSLSPLSSPASSGPDSSGPGPSPSPASLSSPASVPVADVPSHPESGRGAIQEPGRRAWAWSLAPLLATQALDSASSYGMRELNPLLADPNGGFGVKAAVLKFAVVGALIGAEYLILRKSARSARLFALLNWSGAGVTAGLAVHNYAIR
jgi:hypothetical protein